MPVDFPEIKKFLGIFAQRNTFDVPEGAMEIANNVVISDDDTITKRRGFYKYYEAGADVLNALFSYQNYLIAAFSDAVAYFTGTGTYPNETGARTTLTGATVAIGPTRISRSVEQSGNLYFTSDLGTMKLDTYNGLVFASGAPPGQDLRGQFLPENGPLPADSEIGYRILFGRRDANTNLIIGAPSDILVLSNVPTAAAPYTSVGAGPYTVTVTSAGYNLSVGMSITVSSGSNPAVDGSQSILSATLTTFTFSVIANPGAGTLTFKTSRTPLIQFSIPASITSTVPQWFFQIYRTSPSITSGTSPDADFKIVQESFLTSAQITSRMVFYTDDVDDILVEFASELYTNPNSREGEFQANARAPLCEDIDLFSGYVFYANCRTRHTLELSVVAPAALTSGDYVEVKVDAMTRRYVAWEGVGNQTVRPDSITNAAGNLRIDYVAHGLTNGFTVVISEIMGGTLTVGTYFVVAAAANSFQISLTSGGAPIGYSAVTSLYFEGLTNGAYGIFSLLKTGISVAAQLRVTAGGLIKAINRDPSTVVCGNYTSGITGTPGQMRITADGFGGTISLRASSIAAGLAFGPVLPDSFASGIQVTSSSDSKPASIFVSKVNEPEAVPVVNEVIVGSKNKAILRILALRDSVVVLKQDGIFKITGDSPRTFNVTPLDNTIRTIAANSAARLNNQVYLLSNQGVCIATDTSVEIVSRRIENLIEPIIGQPLLSIASETAAVGYDSDRTYRLATIAPNETVQTTTYVHNTLNDTWVSSDFLFSAGVVGPSDTLYLVSSGDIYRERKTQTKIDFMGQNYAATVVSVASDKLSAVINITTYAPQAGDCILKNNVINRFYTVTALSGVLFMVTFQSQCTLVAADALQLYARIISKVSMAPYHAGAIGRAKQVSQLQIRTRSSNIRRISISFETQSFGGSELTVWEQDKVTSSASGWGNLPWGFFPWGLSEGINNIYSTQPATPIRILVPQFAQRSSWVKLVLMHSEAGEPLDIQALCWAVRGYKERVSK